VADEPKKAVCVIGWPVEHSRSPLIHNYWIKQHGLDAEYRREAVAPDQFAGFVGRLAEHGYVGANVTVPHKEVALAASEPDRLARAVGAANTLWLDGTTLRSTNTDVDGFLGNLDERVPLWDRGLKSALVLGAGGAARSVVFALIERGAQRVHVANRRFSRAHALRETFGDRVEPHPWEEMDALLPRADLLVNATSLGMTGQPPLTITMSKLPTRAVVADLVYVPLATPLLRAARSSGRRTADGLGMLLHQAVGGFERWFGVRPRVTEGLRRLLEADLMRP
jgi:shikimate dehydrogenase